MMSVVFIQSVRLEAFVIIVGQKTVIAEVNEADQLVTGWFSLSPASVGQRPRLVLC